MSGSTRADIAESAPNARLLNPTADIIGRAAAKELQKSDTSDNNKPQQTAGPP